MNRNVKLALSCLWFLGLCLPGRATASEEPLPAIDRLRIQNAQFEKQIVRVAPNVYSGVGYGASNESLERMLSEHAEVLVSGHTLPNSMDVSTPLYVRYIPGMQAGSMAMPQTFPTYRHARRPLASLV